jgi:ornithine cyclodeaminase/alanine dehydrogenase-like protein (mu-crystallin family)
MKGVDLEDKPELAQLVAGKVAGRRDDQQMTCFCNNIGLGFQFAAVGARVLTLALQRGVGRELPTDWFTQDVHP